MNACSMSPECGDRLETKVMMSQRNRWRKAHQPGLPKKISLFYIHGFQLGA